MSNTNSALFARVPFSRILVSIFFFFLHGSSKLFRHLGPFLIEYETRHPTFGFHHIAEMLPQITPNGARSIAARARCNLQQHAYFLYTWRPWRSLRCRPETWAPRGLGTFRESPTHTHTHMVTDSGAAHPKRPDDAKFDAWRKKTSARKTEREALKFKVSADRSTKTATNPNQPLTRFWGPDLCRYCCCCC